MRPQLRLLARGLGIASLCATAGCGQFSTHATADAATARLQSDVATVTSAAADGNTAGARTALATLHTDLNAARDAGALTPTQYAKINTAIASVTDDLTRIATPTTSSSTTSAPSTAPALTTAPTVPPAPVSTRATKEHDHGPGKGGGKD